MTEGEKTAQPRTALFIAWGQELNAPGKGIISEFFYCELLELMYDNYKVLCSQFLASKKSQLCLKWCVGRFQKHILFPCFVLFPQFHLV